MRIGIFGGTFSPPHNGHIKAAEAFVSELDLQKLFIVPASVSPCKIYDDIASAEDRLEMCRLAFNIPVCEISDEEIRIGGISYTVETLKKIKGLYPNDEIYLLLGEDKIEKFGEWKGINEIFSLCIPVFMRRYTDYDGDRLLNEKIIKYREQFGADLRQISMKAFPISSAEIRNMMSKGDDVGRFLPKAVLDYIHEHGICGKR